MGWGNVAAEVAIQSLPGNHITCITDHVQILANKLSACLREAQTIPAGLDGTGAAPAQTRTYEPQT
jgi:hypothetical protein